MRLYLAAAIILTATHAHAERWSATSTTAMAITGNVTLDKDKIAFAGGKFLPIERTSNVSLDDGMGHRVPASFYRVTTPGDPVLVQGNRLCDGKPVTYIAVWHVKPIIPTDAEGRAFAAYSGPNEPQPSVKGSCGTFFYEPSR